MASHEARIEVRVIVTLRVRSIFSFLLKQHLDVWEVPEVSNDECPKAAPTCLLVKELHLATKKKTFLGLFNHLFLGQQKFVAHQ